MSAAFIIGQTIHLAIFMAAVWLLWPYLFNRKEKP